jgi:hypothetical protein
MSLRPIARGTRVSHDSRVPWRLSDAGPGACHPRCDGPASETLHRLGSTRIVRLGLVDPNFLIGVAGALFGMAGLAPRGTIQLS